MKPYEGKKIMKEKGYVNKAGATTACCFQSTKPWQGTGRILIGDL